MIDFVILYEIPNRELESDILLMKELKKRGFSVELQLFPFENVAILEKKYKNNVNTLLIHSAYDDIVLFNLVYDVFGQVRKIVNLQWEQIRNKQWEEDFDSYLYPKGCARNVKHVCWGERLADCLMNYGIKKDNIFLDGPMQMDSLRDEYSSFYISRDDLLRSYEIPEKSKVVLFISSFSLIDAEEHIRQEVELNLGKEYVNNVIKISSDSRKIVLEWLIELAKERPDSFIIYRPHPEERKSKALEKFASEGSNIKVIGSYGIKQWIKASDKIYIWNSTSAGEVFAAQKNFNVIRPIDIGSYNNILFEENKHYIKSFSELVADFDKDGGYDTTGIAKYYNVQSTPSFIRLADHLEKYIYDKDDVFVWEDDLLRKCKKWKRKRRFISFLASLVRPVDSYLLRESSKHDKHFFMSMLFRKRLSKLVYRKTRRERFKKDEIVIRKKMQMGTVYD